MALWIILAIVVLLVIWIISMYNSLVKLKIKVDNSWSDIRVFLKKRFDLIPNLVNTVKGYAAHESQTFEKVTQARNAAVAVPPGDVHAAAEANQALGGALRGLLAIAENYPELKANTNFWNYKPPCKILKATWGMPGAIITPLYGITTRLFNNFPVLSLQI